ncbi:MAG: hypothetical protein D6784_04235, partial [Chloroflexi bacterium]
MVVEGFGSGLLVLMLFPLIGAVLFAVLIVYLIRKRQQTRGPAPSPQTADKAEAVELDTRILSKSRPAVEPVPRADPPPAPPAPPASPAAPAELMRLLRHPSGQLVVEIGGRQYTRLSDVTDRETGQRILQITAHLLQFTRGMVAGETGLKSVGAPAPSALPPAFPSPAQPPAPAEPVKPAAPPAAKPPAPTLTPPAETRPIGPEPLIELNLAEEINRIVQTQLALSPLADTTDITITADPRGGIRINVNGQYYASPDEI